ncbi:MAG: LysR family transcriptional regulator [Flavobacteriales bacterium]
MTLQQLQYITALDDHRHFVKAAEACFVTQPTLTMQVRKLEEELNVVLFDRRKQPIRPTDTGVAVIAHARSILHEAEQLKGTIDEIQHGMAGEARIGIIPTLAPYLLPLFLTRFAADNPAIQLAVDERKTSGHPPKGFDAEIWISAFSSPQWMRGIRESPLVQEPFLGYLPKGHALWKRASLQRSDLQDQAITGAREGHCFREQTLSLCDTPERRWFRQLTVRKRQHRDAEAIGTQR